MDDFLIDKNEDEHKHEHTRTPTPEILDKSFPSDKPVADADEHHHSHASSSSDEIEKKVVDLTPEMEIHQKLEEYYDKAYFNYQVCNLEDHIQQKVWSIHYDETYDLIFIFLGKIEILEG